MAIDPTAFAGPIGSGMLDDNPIKMTPPSSGFTLKMGRGSKFKTFEDTVPFEGQHLKVCFEGHWGGNI